MLELVLEKEQGKGRAFIVLYEENTYSDFASGLFGVLAQETRTLLVKSPVITNSNWAPLTISLQKLLLDNSIRQASFVCFSAASALVLNLCLLELKFIRTLVIVDACTRPHPTLLSRFIDKLENYLPLGLPLRSFSQAFDAKSFLQRVRCPVLVVTSSRAGAYLKFQAEAFHSQLPTGWVQNLSSQNEVQELNQHVLEFQKIQAKCPQGNRLKDTKNGVVATG